MLQIQGVTKKKEKETLVGIYTIRTLVRKVEETFEYYHRCHNGVCDTWCGEWLNICSESISVIEYAETNARVHVNQCRHFRTFLGVGEALKGRKNLFDLVGHI